MRRSTESDPVTELLYPTFCVEAGMELAHILEKICPKEIRI